MVWASKFLERKIYAGVRNRGLDLAIVSQGLTADQRSVNRTRGTCQELMLIGLAVYQDFGKRFVKNQLM